MPKLVNFCVISWGANVVSGLERDVRVMLGVIVMDVLRQVLSKGVLTAKVIRC